jgi:hypothetical protein
MLLAAEFVPLTLHVAAFRNHAPWQIHYLGQHVSTHFFHILSFNGINTCPIAIIKVTDQEFFFIFLESHIISTDPLEIFHRDDKQLQGNFKNYPLLEKTINYSNEVVSNNTEEFEIKNNHSQSRNSSCNVEEIIQEIQAQIRIVQAPGLTSPMSWQEKVQYHHHRNTIAEYYKLLAKPDLANSESDLDKIEKILQQAENDDVLSLLLNEVDQLIVQGSSSDAEPDDRYADYQKWAEVFKIHVDSCNQLDSEVSRLMTTISSLIEELQNVAEKSLDSPEVFEQKIEEKVESLELLMQEAKVEKHRRKLRICLNKPQTTPR